MNQPDDSASIWDELDLEKSFDEAADEIAKTFGFLE